MALASRSSVPGACGEAAWDGQRAYPTMVGTWGSPRVVGSSASPKITQGNPIVQSLTFANRSSDQHP